MSSHPKVAHNYKSLYSSKLRSLSAPAILIGGVIGAAMALTTWAQPVALDEGSGIADLQLEIAVNKKALSESRVRIDSTLTNRLSRSISLPIWNTPFSEHVTGRVFIVEKRLENVKFGNGNIDEGYTVVPYTGIMVKRGSPSAQDYMVLEPGRQISHSLDITDAYDFAENSQLRISYDRPIDTGNNNFQSLTSNVIEFLF